MIVAQTKRFSLVEAESLERYPTGASLFMEGDRLRGIYLIRSGIIELSCRSGDRVAPSSRLALPEEALGLSALLTDRLHECSATARTDCVVAFIAAAVIKRMFHGRAATRLELLKLLSADITAAYEQLRRAV